VSSARDLTSRDIDLVVMLARGHTTDRIAREMRLSRHTVGERISLLLERFGCRNRTELVAYFYAHGLLEAGTWPPSSVVRPVAEVLDLGVGGVEAVIACAHANGSMSSDPDTSRTVPAGSGGR
jgi:DNA-binding CsgD family transcriptional regulator